MPNLGQRKKNKKKMDKTHNELRKEADMEFSKYIRLRDANEYGIVKCCTCGKERYWTDQMDCGHFVKRNHEATRFDEKNCNTQCRECNSYQNGKEAEHKEYIDNKYGKGTADKLRLKGRKTKIRKKIEYITIKEHYKILRKKLEKELLSA